jgi:hypothetical protein
LIGLDKLSLGSGYPQNHFHGKVFISFPIHPFLLVISQGKAKKTRKFAAVKRLLNPNDARLCVLLTILDDVSAHQHFNSKENQVKEKKRLEEAKSKAVRRV